jgi:enoyl-CoA hydratase/carnithine racemase
MSSTVLESLPAHGDHLLVSVPFEHALQITFNRPQQLNAMSLAMERDLVQILAWFDSNPDLWCLIITGTGRAFCAGADLTSYALSYSHS